MKEAPDDRLRSVLQDAAPPFAGSQLERDLWPIMLRRLDERTVVVSGLDWALAALLLAFLLLFPQAIPTLLYHL